MSFLFGAGHYNQNANAPTLISWPDDIANPSRSIGDSLIRTHAVQAPPYLPAPKLLIISVDASGMVAAVHGCHHTVHGYLRTVACMQQVRTYVRVSSPQGAIRGRSRYILSHALHVRVISS
jgi:hypothetical protein